MRGVRFGLTAGAALVLLSAGAARMTLHAAPRQAATALSPEEAVIAIKPLQLAASDVPPGYALGAITVDTPVSDALRQSVAGADPYAALGSLTAEGTQACSVQGVMPPAAAPLTDAQLTICVMADQPSAQNVVAGTARAIDPAGGTLTQETAPPDLTLGDGQANVWRLVQTDSNGRTSTAFDLRWSRGQVAFELRAQARAGKEDQSGTNDLGRSIDGGEAMRPPVALGAPTVVAPVTEQQRLYATLNSQTAIVPASAAPSRLYTNTIQLPAEAVLTSNNPTATLHLLDETFRRAVYANEVFRTPDRQLLYGQRVTVDADAPGAGAELMNPSSDGFFFHGEADDSPTPNGTQADTELTPPLQLGDGTRAFKTLISYPDPRNNFVTFTLRWTHGPAVLQARIGAAASKNQQLSDLVPWAQQVEQTYQASALPDVSRLLSAPASVARFGRPLAPIAWPPAAALPAVAEAPRSRLWRAARTWRRIT